MDENEFKDNGLYISNDEKGEVQDDNSQEEKMATPQPNTFNYEEELDKIIDKFKGKKRRDKERAKKAKKEHNIDRKSTREESDYQSDYTKEIKQDRKNAEKTDKTNNKTSKLILSVIISLFILIALILCLYFFVIKADDKADNSYNIYSNNTQLGSVTGEMTENMLTITAIPNGMSAFIGWAEGGITGNIISEELTISVEYSNSTSYYAIFNLTTEAFTYRDIQYTLYKEAGYAQVNGFVENVTSNTLSIPNFISDNEKDYKVYSIATQAFANDMNLSQINISSSVYKIGNSAFRDCSSLTNVQLNDNTKLLIEEYAFANCINLEEINLPQNTTILNHAFENCPKLIINENV